MASTTQFSSRDAAAFATRIRETESSQSYDERSKLYYDYLHASEADKIPVIKATTKSGKQITLLIKMPNELIGSMGDTSNFYTDIACEWGCATCVRRLKKLRGLVGSDGKAVFCRLAHPSRSDLQVELNSKCEKMISEFNKKYNTAFRWEFEIVNTDTLFSPLEISGKPAEIEWPLPQSARDYRHYSYKPEFISETLGEYETIWVPKALSKYSPLISNLLSKIGSVSNMVTSCSILSELLKKATYGKNQAPAVDWFINILNKVASIRDQWDWIPFHERLNILANVICQSSIVEGDSNSAHIGFFHTINGFVLDIIENGTSPEGVVKMLEERNAPDKYRRKTGEVKEGHIQAAEKFCETLENTVETIEELEKHAGCVKVMGKVTSSPKPQTASGAFAQMRENTSQNKKNKFDGFASRMTVDEPSKANTLPEIIRDVSSGKISKIEIYSEGLETIYIAKTNLDPSDLAFGSLGHLWCFGGKYSRDTVFKSSCVYDGYGYGGKVINWWDVTHLYQFKTTAHKNLMFVIKNSNSKKHTISGNCLFPEFLAPKHHSAGKAIEKLCKMTSVSMPPDRDAEIAYGVGTSVGFADGKLVNPLRVRITSGSKNIQREIEITNAN